MSSRRGTRDPALPALPIGTHVIGCAYGRCVGFAEGNTLSVRHGAYATVQRAPRATELAEAIIATVPGASPSDEVAVAALALIVARLERVSAALEAQDDSGDAGRLDIEARAWLRTALSFCEALALTPATRARLGIETAMAGGSS